jgi:hypothetical protein
LKHVIGMFWGIGGVIATCQEVAICRVIETWNGYVSGN